MADWRRASSFVLPSLVGGIAAAVVVGLADGLFNTDTPLHILATAGYVSIFAAPLALLAALIVRLLWRGWCFDELMARVRVKSGGVPALAAWLLYLIGAGWLMAAVSFNAVRMILSRTVAKDVVALGAALIIITGLVVVVVLSGPMVRLLGIVTGRLDAAIVRRLGRSLMTPALLSSAAGVLVVGLVWLAWLVSVRPRLGPLDVGFIRYLIGFAVVSAAIHGLWPLLERRRWYRLVLGVGVGALGIAAIATAVYVRHHRAYAMLEVWGQTRLAGDAVDLLYDIQSLRGDLHLGEFAPAERPGAPHHNVVLITIDTVRADHTPPYGGRAKMPALAQLAKQGTLFEWAFSPGNVTRRSLPTIATGVSPHRIHGRVAGWALRLDPRHVMVAERFRAAGYDTAGFFCCGSQFGARHRLGLIRGIDHVELKKDGTILAEMARKWLAARAAEKPTRPLFIWFHYIEPHLWSEHYPASKHGKKPGLRYDLSLEAADRILATTLVELRSAEHAGDTYVIVSADHGEGVGDRGRRFHSTNLYNSQIRVPLIVVGPGVAPRRVPRPVGLVDLAPTMLDLAGYVPPGMPQMDGVSLAPIIRGEIEGKLEEGEAYSAMVVDRSVSQGMRSLVAGRYKFIETVGRKPLELYDLTRDKKERNNLAEKKPEVLADMKKRMAARRAIDAIAPF